MKSRHTMVETELGELTLVASDEALIGLYFPHHWVRPERAQLGEEVAVDTDVLLSEAARQLKQYLAGERTTFDLPIALSGDEFQQQVWALLAEIPFGEITTYGELAERLGDKSLAQVVGRAVGHNPVSIIVPCHRVVGKNGKLTGYAGGLKRKQALLELEEPESVRGERLF